MTSNGATALEVEAVATAPKPQPSDEPLEETPQLEVQPMDYWREMTQRQIERLKGEIKAFEDQAAPLRRQLTVLQSALSGVSVQQKHGGSRVHPFNPNIAKNKGEDISDEQRELVKQMVNINPGVTTTEIRAAMPSVKSGQVYSTIYNERQKLIKEAKPR